MRSPPPAPHCCSQPLRSLHRRRRRCAFPNLSGGYQGFNIDLANEIGKRVKRTVIIDAAQFSGLIPALQAGTYDFLSAPTTVTPERAENLLFTEGYLNTDYQFL